MATSANPAGSVFSTDGRSQVLACNRDAAGSCPCFRGRTRLGPGDELATVSAARAAGITVAGVHLGNTDRPPGAPCRQPGGPAGSAWCEPKRSGKYGTALPCRIAAADGLPSGPCRSRCADKHRGLWIHFAIQPLHRSVVGGLFSGSTGQSLAGNRPAPSSPFSASNTSAATGTGFRACFRTYFRTYTCSWACSWAYP